MLVELVNSSQASQGPVDISYIKAILSENFSNIASSKDFTQSIADNLSTKSSMHKFLVSVTKVETEKEAEAKITINSAFSAVWDEKKDGFYCFKVVGDSIHLVSLYWISVDI